MALPAGNIEDRDRSILRAEIGPRGIVIVLYWPAETSSRVVGPIVATL